MVRTSAVRRMFASRPCKMIGKALNRAEMKKIVYVLHLVKMAMSTYARQKS
jgi:hypothetical protein